MGVDSSSFCQGVDLLAGAGEAVAFGFRERVRVGAVHAVAGERVGGIRAGRELLEGVAMALRRLRGGDEVAGDGPVID